MITESGARTTGIIRKAIDYCKGLSGEAVRYIIVGVLTTLVSYSVFTAMRLLAGLSVDLSNLISIVCGILFAYVTNKLIVFRNRCDTKAELATEFLKFVGARLFTLALEFGTVKLSVEVIGQNEFIGKVEAQVLVVIANYIISKVIVFRRKREDS